MPGSSRRSQSKFTREGFSLCLRMYAENCTPTEIHKHFVKTNQPHPILNGIYEIVKRVANQKEIDHYRKIYYSKIDDVPITHKRARAEDIQYIRNALKKTIDTLFKTDGSIKPKSLKKFLSLTKRFNEILNTAREEIERRPGQVVALTQHLHSTGDITNEELIKKIRDVKGECAELIERGATLEGDGTDVPGSGARPEGQE